MRVIWLLLLPTMLCAQSFDELATTDGRSYHLAKVISVDPDGIRISHRTGVAKVTFDKLPDSLRKQYSVDLAAAKRMKEAEAREGAAIRDHQLLRQKRAARFSRWEELMRSGQATQEEKKVYGALKAAVSKMDSQGASIETTSEIVDGVFNRKVVTGMPPQIVLLAWGKPLLVGQIPLGGSPRECWQYNSGGCTNTCVFFEDGRVSEILE